MDHWKGKVAIVTGASAGIGASIVEKLVQSGLKVVGIARRTELVEELAGKLRNYEGKLYALKADIGVEEDVYRSFRWIKENVGNVHIMINNAGIAVNNTLINGDPKVWKRTIDINLIGATLCSKLAIENMLESKVDGHVINVNSTSGHHVHNLPKLNMYPASKFALRAMGEVLKTELRTMESRIKISSISPGVVDTEILMSFFFESKENPEYKSLVKLTSEDIADSVIFILSTPSNVLISELIIHHVHQEMR